MKYIKIKHGSENAKELHKKIVIAKNAYSLTFNIAKRLTDYHLKQTYDDSCRDIKLLFKSMAPYLDKVMINPEYNQKEQIHWHTYIVTKDGVSSEKLVDVIKYNIMAYKFVLWTDHGYGWKLKGIDELSDELNGYPFKDIERSRDISINTYSPFACYHYYGVFDDNIFLPKKTMDHKTKTKLNDFFKII